MTLHIFNPEHDLALASGLSNFTPPHAGRQLRHDLAFLPALWAADGDVVLTGDATQADHALLKVSRAAARYLGCSLPLVTFSARAATAGCKAVDPWGWDAALCAALRRGGLPAGLLPEDSRLASIRQLSHRRTSARLLPLLQRRGTVGESFECRTEAEALALAASYGSVVMKAPWSSSGRGLRFVSGTMSQPGWLSNLLQRQGSVMVEPRYDRVKDFGMEFVARADGRVDYCGLSLFHTANGAYTGNILATEQAKRQIIGHYLPADLLDAVRSDICLLLPRLIQGRYQGPLGVDMMVVAAASGFLLHPCVEINLRRTMGHAALALTPADDELTGVMRIVCADSHYQLKIQRL